MIMRQLRWRLAGSYTAFLAWNVQLANHAQQHRMPVCLYALLNAPYGDKICHFFLVGWLAFLANWVFECRTVKIMGRHLLIGSLLCFLAATCEETSQAFNPHRCIDLVDFAMNAIGVLLIGRLARWIPAIRVPSPEPI